MLCATSSHRPDVLSMIHPSPQGENGQHLVSRKMYFAASHMPHWNNPLWYHHVGLRGLWSLTDPVMQHSQEPKDKVMERSSCTAEAEANVRVSKLPSILGHNLHHILHFSSFPSLKHTKMTLISENTPTYMRRDRRQYSSHGHEREVVFKGQSVQTGLSFFFFFLMC